MEFTKERYDELMMILDQTNNRPAGLRYPDWIFNFLNRVDEEILTMEAGGYLFKVYRYFAENRDQDCPLFINIHGGGWVVPHESCDSCYSAWIADHIQGVVLDIDYTTTTDAGWRTMFEQCCHVLEYAFQNAKSLGCDPEKICIGGYSAGGHLAAGVVLWSVERGYSVAGQVLCYAPLDLRIKKQIMPEDPIRRNMVLRGKAYQELLFRGETEIRDNPLVSPILADGKWLAKVPRTLVITAGKCDFRFEDEQFAATLAANGIEVTMKRFVECRHGFMPHFFDQWEEASELLARFLCSTCANKTAATERNR